MQKTGKSSERNRSTFDITAEILRQLQEPAGIASILPNYDVDFERPEHRFGFMKSRELVWTDPLMAVAIESCEDTYFENRKKRPQERGRKKRRKGKWDPLDRLWNSANLKNLCFRHLLEQD